MKIGLMAGATEATGTGINDIIEFSKQAEARGFDSIWLANIFGIDAVMACALAGAATERIELGTAVTPSYPRHPLAMAQQALTANAACSGRFAMGIGLSHKLVIEDMMGLSYARPASHMNEYLQVLSPLLRGEPVSFSGDEYRVNAALDVPDGAPCPLLVAALGPRMLKLAGEYADGTITWVTGARTLENHIIPTISEAAAGAGRAAPRIVCGLPVAVTEQPAEAKAMVAESLKMYGMLPSYRAMLDREGVEGPADVALIGSANEVADRLAALREIGVTDFNAAITPTDPDVFDNTMAVLEAAISN
ncbi:TIGR03564 family F420-dependent LLM class oxidoreductase [Halieaceae bacterium IMCC14734]|uniref:TIGR03564 family F420-dependent LLM class oxidoreductase n=1 Tax=Candidatus Litorirhabdus singularis TaxID=2518993 RepID=A0ABT3TJ99_9GAMM|nr:TIGR03564 family F420-dependent LLM class oxidoreductase [Candidatus Litorirhabdus singularis]MCX2982387.1 TIGR03564 family F420-dependent LLM class oxidoreductase [Candidatus Litorirhabdus singularis]